MANITGLNHNAFKNSVEGMIDPSRFITHLDGSPSAARNEVSQALPSSTVGDYVSILEKSIQELNEAVHFLGGRLSPILLEQRTSDAPEPPKPPMCVLSSCLDDSVRTVTRTTAYVRFLIDSVQL